MEELLSLKWNNHRSTFIHVLGILRDKQLYTDATIACEGKFYSVHKLVLSTCSDYFSAMLDRTNCKNPVIVLKDIKCEDLEALLDYMYLGEVNVRQSDLATLIKAAECLRVKGLAVPDDEPPTTKKRETQSSRRNDTSSSPPAKRKRRSDVVDDGRDDVRPVRVDHRQSSPARSSSRPKSPAISSTPLSPVNHRSTPQKQQPSDPIVASSPKTSTSQPGDDGGASEDGIHSSENTNNQAYSSVEHTEPFVKVEMDDGSGADLEAYDLSNDGAFKEEDDGAGSNAGDGGDLSNDLPEFLQQAASGPMAGGAFAHSSFTPGSSSFQPGDLAGWQGDGSNVGFPHLNFSSSESASQQNAPGTAACLSTVVGTRSSLPAASTPRMVASAGRFRNEAKFKSLDIFDESPVLDGAALFDGAKKQETAVARQRVNDNYVTNESMPQMNKVAVDLADGESVSKHELWSCEHSRSSIRRAVKPSISASRLFNCNTGETRGECLYSYDDDKSAEFKALSQQPSCSKDVDENTFNSYKFRFHNEINCSGSHQACSDSAPFDEAAKSACPPPLVCTVCGRAVYGRNRRQNMENHMLTHSNVRPHKCSFCSYSSIQLGNLNRHLRNVHKIMKCESENMTLGSVNIWQDSLATVEVRSVELPVFLDSNGEGLIEFPSRDSEE